MRASSGWVPPPLSPLSSLSPSLVISSSHLGSFALIGFPVCRANTYGQYSDEAARLLARELLDGATSATTICVVSAPSVFVALKNLLREARESGAETTWQGEPELVLLEHDDRFGIFGEFVFYDFQQPLKLPGKS